MLLVRYVIMMTFSYFHGKNKGIDFEWFGMRLFGSFPWETRKSIIWRCVFGLGSNICAMGTIWFVPLFISQSILSCTVFVTMLLAWLINNEKISFREILMIIGGVAGVFVLIIPNWL